MVVIYGSNKYNRENKQKYKCTKQDCIVSVGAVIDHNTIVGDYSHINADAVMIAGCKFSKGIYRQSEQ